MKAEELMIGDWVLQCELNTPVKVQSIMRHYLDESIYFYHEAGEYISNVYKLEPIPLTPEILEKNGFILDKFIKDYMRYDGVEERIIMHNDKERINPNNEWFVLINNEDYKTMMICELSYVHELQHLLKLCGIDKEIVV